MLSAEINMSLKWMKAGLLFAAVPMFVAIRCGEFLAAVLRELGHGRYVNMECQQVRTGLRE